MRADLARIRGKLQTDRRMLFTGWFLLIVGVVQVPLTIVAAIFDDHQSAGVKALNIIIGVWVLGFGITFVLLGRSGHTDRSATPPELPEVPASQE